MQSGIFKPVREDLELVQSIIKKEFIIKAGHIDTFAHLRFSYINENIRPALVLLSSRIYGGEAVKAAALASVIQFIYMASKVHRGVSEIDSDFIRGDSDPRDGSQFPVLVGDYLYGKFFTFLCDAELISLLEPLARIICDIQEGCISKKLLTGQSSTDDILEVVRKETSGLFAGCCSFGARLAGAEEKEQEIMWQFGRNLGMAYGIIEHGMYRHYAEHHIKEALGHLAGIPNHPDKTLLESIVGSLSLSFSPARRMVI